MGVSRDTFYEWKKKYPDISDTLKRGKDVVDIMVENALLKRALGYEYSEIKNETDGSGKKKVTVTVKQVVPDVAAQIFWLKNRKPHKWRDKPVDENGEEGTQSDGLMQALDARAAQLFEGGDDSTMLPEEEDDETS